MSTLVRLMKPKAKRRKRVSSQVHFVGFNCVGVVDQSGRKVCVPVQDISKRLE